MMIKKQRLARLGFMFATFMIATSAFAADAGETAAADKERPKSPQFSIRSIDDQNLPDDAKEKLKERAIKAKRSKIIDVSDHEIPDMDAGLSTFRKQAKPLSRAIPEDQILLKPMRVDASRLKLASDLGAAKAGAKTKDGWTGLVRMFQSDDLGLVILEELDILKSNGSVTFATEMINAEVNGAPAVISIMRGRESNTHTKLVWYKDGILFTLRTKKVDDIAREQLLQIARSLY